MQQELSATRDQPLSSMLPEQAWGVPHHHLTCRANELATWLTKLVECPNVRGPFAGNLNRAGAYLAKSGRYLDTFLDAVQTIPRIDQHLIRKHQKTLLKREIVKLMSDEHDFSFRERAESCGEGG